MSFDDDRVELQGSDYARKLRDLKSGLVTGKLLVETAPNHWEFKLIPPLPGKGQYIERSPNGECRLYTNRGDGDGHYQKV